MMNVGLKNDYVFGFNWAKIPNPYTMKFLCELSEGGKSSKMHFSLLYLFFNCKISSDRVDGEYAKQGRTGEGRLEGERCSTIIRYSATYCLIVRHKVPEFRWLRIGNAA